MKVSELTGAALDWAVAKCEGVEVEYINDGITRCLLRVSPFTGRYSASTTWAQGGPIIEREKISLRHDYWENGGCKAFIDRGGSAKNIIAPMYGPTPLIAAMRCYVASKMGDDIEVPPELK